MTENYKRRLAFDEFIVAKCTSDCIYNNGDCGNLQIVFEGGSFGTVSGHCQRYIMKVSIDCNVTSPTSGLNPGRIIRNALPGINS